jgi:hypothetical protein
VATEQPSELTLRALELFLAAVFVALIVLACSTGRLPAWKAGQLTAAQRAASRTVLTSTQYISRQDWEASAYWRPGDFLDMPIYLVIATDHTACLVPATDYTVVQDGERYPCTTQWRQPRA